MHLTMSNFIETFIGLGLIIQNVYGLKHIESQANILYKIFVGILSVSVCYKMYLFLGPFNIMVGLIFFIDGLKNIYG